MVTVGACGKRPAPGRGRVRRPASTKLNGGKRIETKKKS